MPFFRDVKNNFFVLDLEGEMMSFVKLEIRFGFSGFPIEPCSRSDFRWGKGVLRGCFFGGGGNCSGARIDIGDSSGLLPGGREGNEP